MGGSLQRWEAMQRLPYCQAEHHAIVGQRVCRPLCGSTKPFPDALRGWSAARAPRVPHASRPSPSARSPHASEQTNQLTNQLTGALSLSLSLSLTGQASVAGLARVAAVDCSIGQARSLCTKQMVGRSNQVGNEAMVRGYPVGNKSSAVGEQLFEESAVEGYVAMELIEKLIRLTVPPPPQVGHWHMLAL